MKNQIYKSSGIYPKESCKKAINWFEENINTAQPGRAGVKVLDNLELQINLEQPSNFFDLGFTLLNGLKGFIKEYNCYDDYLARWCLSTDPLETSMCKWEPDNYYNHLHCESGPNRSDRIFSWMMYLKDIKNGGGTEFLYQDITMKSREGDLLIFPSGPSHMHRGENAKFETKYTITGHFCWER